MLLQELPGFGGAPKFEYGELAAELTAEHAKEEPAATAERTMQLCLFSATFPFRTRARAKQLLRGRQVRDDDWENPLSLPSPFLSLPPAPPSLPLGRRRRLGRQQNYVTDAIFAHSEFYYEI
jgi:hypothetical protein